ncbi:hypothetical protein V495_04402 [Pseudogymnoascus sp. VKM F-4514 (FW-929)]|nr:hypothetical protein V490_02504 [Pseudogymnoascus sp. VKM F-3557]KFY42654.1 hypothetical protein V495_04402 [Pseudogymnoascus sp. VKM F-4514 (FW-929)]KFY56215.1 hypothetical protein V497_06430 [Pseudogymnoascus sp. VKM F-4516 (FW-969)]
MSSRRRLVSRTTQDAASSPAPRTQASSSASRSALPPYEPPVHPLTFSAKQQLNALVDDTDYGKYRKHLATAITTLSNATVDSNDTLSLARAKLERQVERRRARESQREDEEGEMEKTEDEVAMEERVAKLEIEVERLTKEAEMATRELIDYSEELKRQESLIRGVAEKAATAPALRLSRNTRRRRAADDSEDDNSDDPDFEEPSASADPGADTPSVTELLAEAQAAAAAQYAAKSLRTRYADNADYQNFKKHVHDASNHSANAPPLPPSSAWFEDESVPSRSRRGAANGNESDEDIVFAGAVSSLKCPLTLKLFVTPYSNRVCRHTFEKSALLEMFEAGATVFYENSQARGRNRGPGVRKLKCPSSGCDAMLQLGDFYEDEMVRRQVKRAKAAEAAEGEESEGEEEGRAVDVDMDSKDQEFDGYEEVQVAGTQM